jgi:signal transduction histidine kinase
MIHIQEGKMFNKSSKDIFRLAISLLASITAIELADSKYINYIQLLTKEVENLEQKLRMKEYFVAALVHEMRNPLTAMIGSVELIQLLIKSNKKYRAIMTKELKEMFSISHDSGEFLTLMVNNVLDLSKMEMEKLEVNIKPVKIVEALKKVAKMFFAKAKNKGISMSVEIATDLPDYIYFDETRVLQVLLNLVSNGIKFTENGGITIRASWKRFENRNKYEISQLCNYH